MTVDLEDHLRTTFERVMPLLFEDPAAGSGDEPAAIVLVGSAGRPTRGRRVLVAACVAIVIAMISVIAVVRGRDDVTPANHGPDTSTPSVPTSVATPAPADAPPWYGWIKPFLPEGFDYVGVNRIGGGEIFYTAINRMSNVSLEIHIVRWSADEVDDQPTGEVLETPTGYSINTPEGFQVDVACGIGDVNANFRDSNVDTFDYCSGVDRTARRELTTVVAANFPFVEISSPEVTSNLGSTDLASVRALMEPVLADQLWSGQGDLLQGDTVEFVRSVDELRAGGTTATIIRGVYPPNDSGGAPDMYAYGDSSVGWVIREGVGIRVLASHTGSDSGVLGTLLHDIANLVVGDSIGEPDGTTAPTNASTPATATSDSSPLSDLPYQIRSGDFLIGIAYSFCVTGEELVASNGWADGFNHALRLDDVIRIPPTACVRGVPLAVGAQWTSVVVAGDSAGVEAAAGLAAIGIEVSDNSRVSTGLVRPDFYDWSAQLSDILPTMSDGGPLVFAVGGNDGQMFLGTSDPVGSPAWTQEYTNRVHEIVDLVVGSGHPLVWLGVGDAAQPSLDASLGVVRDTTEAALADVDGVVYVDAAQILAGPDGGYTDTIVDLSGNQVVTRTGPAGSLLTPAGQELVAQRVLLAVQAFDMPVEHPSVVVSSGGVYSVIAGDYLAGIAAKTGTSVDDIIAANGWTDGASHPLNPGDTINLPPIPG